VKSSETGDGGLQGGPRSFVQHDFAGFGAGMRATQPQLASEDAAHKEGGKTQKIVSMRPSARGRRPGGVGPSAVGSYPDAASA
jgi:hypothetical protein